MYMSISHMIFYALCVIGSLCMAQVLDRETQTGSQTGRDNPKGTGDPVQAHVQREVLFNIK